MNNEVLLKILDVLGYLDSRMVQVEESLANLNIDNHYFSSFGSDYTSIEEIRNIIESEMEGNK